MKPCLLASLLLTVGGCAPQPAPQRASERLILLPSASGKPSSIVVTTRDATVELNTPYAVIDVRGTAIAPGASTPEEVERRYGGLLSAQPRTPRSYTLFFVLGTAEFTPSSKVTFEKTLKEIGAWPGAEVVVIGHTDRLGSQDFNDALGRKRAEIVASRLASAGVSPERIEVVSRGERDPLIPTPDEQPEPRNRRVEIKVR